MMAQEKLFQIGVKALITDDNGKILLLDSGEWHLKHQTQHWDIPGGRIQEGHTVLGTLQREVEEETGIAKINEPKFFTAAMSNFQDIPIDNHKVGLLLMVYKVKIPKNSKITLSHEHSAYEWADEKTAAQRLSYKYPREFTSLLLKS
jgi:ADP-ribose pyrophosphatase YjhB (NUDIX family)